LVEGRNFWWVSQKHSRLLGSATPIQARPVAKKLAFARRVSDSYRRFAPRIAEDRDSYYFNLAGTFRVFVSFKKLSALRAEYSIS
jgi:hypothetical protein